jgi:hypothetical protein
MEKKIYPEVELVPGTTMGNMNCMLISTYLRKEQGGAWHLQLISAMCTFGEGTETEEIVRWVNEFHKKVYLYLILGAVDYSISDSEGRQVFQLDEEQTPETTRLELTLYKPHAKQ